MTLTPGLMCAWWSEGDWVVLISQFRILNQSFKVSTKTFFHPLLVVWCKEGKNVDKLVFPWHKISRKSKTTDDWAFWPSFYSVAYVYLIIHIWHYYSTFITYIRWSVARVASGLWWSFNGAVPAVNSICLIRSTSLIRYLSNKTIFLVTSWLCLSSLHYIFADYYQNISPG